jgi:hypothetical protein
MEISIICTLPKFSVDQNYISGVVEREILSWMLRKYGVKI